MVLHSNGALAGGTLRCVTRQFKNNKANRSQLLGKARRRDLRDRQANANVNLLKFAELFVKMVSAALDGYRYRYRMMNYKYSSPIDADTLS